MENVSERKLATIRQIEAVNPIPNADAIEVATVDGWEVVIKKGEFSVGDKVLYLEIDSWVPHAMAPFLSKGSAPRTYNGVEGERLKTIRLRSQISQGLILPVPPEHQDKELYADLTSELGIIKWEREAPRSNEARGNFPPFLRKTDAERCQNLKRKILDNLQARYEVTVKLDGSSLTIYCVSPEQYGVCSRNLELKTEQEGNHFVDMAKQLFGQQFENITKIEGYAIQGELLTQKIQGNREKVTKPEFYVFGVIDIANQVVLLPSERRKFCETRGLNYVPVLHEDVSLEELGITDIKGLLDYAEGPSMNTKTREGLVFHSIDSDFKFKTISNSYLLKNGE